MASKSRRPRSTARLVRDVSDEDVFEHVINGVRLNHILQMLRETEVLTDNPEDEHDVPDPDERPH